jgi:hypothetical protein
MVLGMPEPSFLRATRAARDTVAVDYARLLRSEQAAKRWTARCWLRSQSSRRPAAPVRLPIWVAAPAA